jgi:hypothetical protein
MTMQALALYWVPYWGARLGCGASVYETQEDEDDSPPVGLQSTRTTIARTEAAWKKSRHGMSCLCIAANTGSTYCTYVSILTVSGHTAELERSKVKIWLKHNIQY